MNDLNVVTVSGNLTRDPEFKQISDDFAVCKFGIAVNRSKKVSDGEYTEEASFFDVECLGRPYAALADRKLRKGNKISLTGRLEQQRWENEAGEKRSKVVIIVSEITGEPLYKKDEDIAAKQDVNPTTGATVSDPPVATPVEAQVTAAVAADDDIPF